MERQVSKGLDERRLPALSRTPLYGQHVVAVAGAERDRPGFGLWSGSQLDDQVSRLGGEKQERRENKPEKLVRLVLIHGDFTDQRRSSQCHWHRHLTVSASVCLMITIINM